MELPLKSKNQQPGIGSLIKPLRKKEKMLITKETSGFSTVFNFSTANAFSLVKSMIMECCLVKK